MNSSQFSDSHDLNMANVDVQSDTYPVDMVRLRAKLVAAFQERNDLLAELEKNRNTHRLASYARTEEIKAEITNVKKMCRENRDRANRLARFTANDIAYCEDNNEHLMDKFRDLDQRKHIAQQRLATNDATRAKMLGTRIPTKEPWEYTSDEIKKYDVDMKNLSDLLRKNDEKISQIHKDIDDFKEMDFDLKTQINLLKEQLSHVNDDYDNATELIIGAVSQRDRYDKCLIMAGMLSDYEEYLSKYCHKSPDALWQTIQDGEGDFHDNWAKSNGTDDTDPDMEYFEEYLYTLVGTCNRHWYEKLKDTYVAECLCTDKGWLGCDTMYCDPNIDGFRPNDVRCSHDNKMYWIDDENWTNHRDWRESGAGWSYGVMFSKYSRELDFTIHSQVPPGHVVASM